MENSEDLLISSTFTLYLMGYALILMRRLRKRRKKRRKRRSRFFFQTRTSLQDYMSRHTPQSFRLAARMTKDSFRDLLELLRPFLRKDERMGSIGSAGTISPGIRLLTTLRLLAGGSARDVSVIFKISLPSVYSIFHETVEIIIALLPLPGIPTDPLELRRKSLEFSLSRSAVLGVPCSPFHGCIAAIDGLTIEIIRPDVQNTTDYVNRYSAFSFPVTATVGPRYEFLTASAVATGSTHDSTAYQLSNIGQFVEMGGIRPGYWIAGDDAYGLSEYVITPFAVSELDAWQSSLNYFLSSLRVHVEQAFGMLRMKFCILQRPLRFKLRSSVRVVCASMALHNFCIARERWFLEKYVESLSQEIIDTAHEELGLWLEESNLSVELELRNDRSIKSRTRDRMLAVVKEKELLRPNDM